MSYSKIQEASVSDGKGGQVMVRKGDKVKLLPTDPTKPKGEDGKFLSRRTKEDYEHWLGPGPYVITTIAKWPCGKISLYIATTGGDNSGEPGAHTDNFQISE